MKPSKVNSTSRAKPSQHFVFPSTTPTYFLRDERLRSIYFTRSSVFLTKQHLSLSFYARFSNYTKQHLSLRLIFTIGYSYTTSHPEHGDVDSQVLLNRRRATILGRAVVSG